MEKNQLFFVFFICVLWLNFVVAESTTGNVYACTNFKIRDEQTVLFGNSEDIARIQPSETVIRFLPKGQTWYDGSKLKYGAVVVGYANGTGYSWYQGGMNEKGLAFDSTSVPYTEPNLHNERPRYLVPEIFSCETISEVIEYKRTHNVYQQEGSVQSFYVDKSGESVVFHIGEDGEFSFFRNDGRFQLATNFYVDDPSRGNPGSNAIRRYSVAEQKLNNIVTNDNMSIESIASILDAVHFEGPYVNTVYSNIFDVTNGDIYLYHFHQFQEVVKINLKEELAKGPHTYRISDLFKQETVDSASNEYYEYPVVIRTAGDLLLLFATMGLDVVLVLASTYVVGKTLLRRINISKNEHLGGNITDREPNKVGTKAVTTKGLLVQIILSLAMIWSLLSFPMIYWNHKGEWWPFFDNIPVLNWPLQPFYAFYNVFLLISLLGLVAIAFVLTSLTNRGEAVRLVKRGLDLGKEKRRRNLVLISIPLVIDVLYLFLETLGIIPKVDWLMLVIMYPLIVTMLVILTPYAENEGIKKQGVSQGKSRINLVRAGILLILIWGLWFLPLLLTGIIDHMYVLLLANLSISMVVFAFFEGF